MLGQGVREGRRTFANTLKYVFMATSANFGNMFSMAGASLFLSFLPLLPKQVLLTNLMTDFPEMTIASDNVDPEMVAVPRRWDIRFIRRFMLVFGLLSSVFDYATFGVLMLVFHADSGKFRTGWFTESVVSAALVVLVIRTRRPMFRSVPSWKLLTATLLVAAAVIVIPFTPLRGPLGFVRISALHLRGHSGDHRRVRAVRRRSRSGSSTRPRDGARLRSRVVSYLRKHWLMFVSYAISAAGLAYVIWNLHPSQLKTDLAGVTWWLVAVAVVLDVAPRALQAVRWQYLLRPSPVGYRFPLLAIYVGTLYSGILPLSSGDAVRGVMVARQTGTSVASVLSTEILERTADAIALILVVWFTLRGLVLPQALRLVLAALEVLIAAALVLGFVLAMRQGEASPLTSPQRSPPAGSVAGCSRSPRASCAPSAASPSAACSFRSPRPLAWRSFRWAALWLILTAYHLHLSFLHAAGLFAIVTIGTFLPNTPGNIGSWQFFCVLGLSLFGVGSAQAAGFSLVAFAVLTVPPILLGVGALVVSPFSWSDLRLGRTSSEGSAAGRARLTQPESLRVC